MASCRASGWSPARRSWATHPGRRCPRSPPLLRVGRPWGNEGDEEQANEEENPENVEEGEAGEDEEEQQEVDPENPEVEEVEKTSPEDVELEIRDEDEGRPMSSLSKKESCQTIISKLYDAFISQVSNNGYK